MVDVHPPEKPDTILMQVRVPCATRDFFPRVNFQCRLLHCPHSPLNDDNNNNNNNNNVHLSCELPECSHHTY